MEFKTLEKTSQTILAKAFNEAFTEYFVPLNMTQERLEEKLATEGIDLKKSVGAFDGDQLIGFILNAVAEEAGKKSTYNGGTGVLPSYRGKNLTKELYRYILPSFRKAGVKRCMLEVITENSAAIKTYKSVGYNIVRKLDCYSGSVNAKNFSSNASVEELSAPDWPHLQTFWDWQPTWQNSVQSIIRSGKKVKIIGIKQNNEIAAYAAFNTAAGRLLQFAVGRDYRRQGLASALFQTIAKEVGGPISLINIDNGSLGSASFLKHMGFSLFLQQYEMEMGL